VELKRARLSDSPLLAGMNLCLIRDEGHPNRMKTAALTRRMRGWLGGAYEARLFTVRGAVAGYCLFRREKGFLYVRQFYVRPGFRRRGIGRKAFEGMRRKVWGAFPLLQLDVLTGNRAGIRFWRSLGFKPRVLRMERTNS
jgi:ribosomal protein S18 acetylase RimI-like enzyme